MGRLRALSPRHRSSGSVSGWTESQYGRGLDHGRLGGRRALRAAPTGSLRRRVGHETVTGLQTREVAPDKDHALLRSAREGRQHDAGDSGGATDPITPGGGED